MDSPTVWNVNDKSDYLSVNLDGLRVDYLGKSISISYYITVKILLYKKYACNDDFYKDIFYIIDM